MKLETGPITGRENNNEITSPFSVLVAFYDAFNRRDLQKMSQHWAHTDDAAMNNPLGGIKRGWNEIQAVYERIFHGQTRVYVELYDYTIHEYADLFYVVGRERGEFQSDAVKLNLMIRTTRLYKRIDGEWKQIHHHGSIDDPDLLKKYQTLLRAGTINK